MTRGPCATLLMQRASLESAGLGVLGPHVGRDGWIINDTWGNESEELSSRALVVNWWWFEDITWLGLSRISVESSALECYRGRAAFPGIVLHSWGWGRVDVYVSLWECVCVCVCAWVFDCISVHEYVCVCLSVSTAMGVQKAVWCH